MSIYDWLVKSMLVYLAAVVGMAIIVNFVEALAAPIGEPLGSVDYLVLIGAQVVVFTWAVWRIKT